MRNISKFSNYNFINEDIKNTTNLVISEKLKNVLLKIKNDPIAKKLLNNVGNDGYEISYIDIVDKDSKYASYLPNDKADRYDDKWNSPHRQIMSWGKIINNLFPKEFTNMDIDKFYNSYRPQIDIKEDSFKLVKGEDIRYWYLEDNWDSSLSSCMRHSKCQSYLDLYCNNPEKCGLLIHFSDKNKNRIVARTLVWNDLINPSGASYTFMDRVYTADGYSKLEATFHKYAIDNKWIYRMTGREKVFLMDNKKIATTITTRLKPIDYKYYPYVDTLHYYTPETGRASSDVGLHAKNRLTGKPFTKYFLQSQYGGKEIVVK